VRLAALVEVEIAAIAADRLVGGAQVMDIGECCGRRQRSRSCCWKLEGHLPSAGT
jgi:hypothetical protein